ncbi:glycine betaine ABC transporter substrate-binding protein [Leptolyngbya iicbica]|uniref:Quaternary ammonium transporter n=2 Tax=Cyanophyceae TaxID=3028117 RepID=A0A4Q7DYU4_9CYAN|nr:glycine betaine ABC transporter substrate-binding protein [Leptolyngbya sp. LK]RZM74451.1 quaternary ammonium transporter [Leptolyngbya sp. LK]
MRIWRRWLSPVALFVCAVFVTVACAGNNGGSDVIRVGSKDFTEQLILGEMYALVLEDAGYSVERKLNLGGTPVAQAALESGEIDLYPEYTGTGLLTVLKAEANSDPTVVYETVSSQYQEQFNLVWLEPSPMNNTQALAMTQEKSSELGITTISEFAAQASNLTLIGPPEFEVREDGLPGLQAAYGNFQLNSYKAVDAGLRYKGLVDGEADVAVAFGTDGEISAFDLVLLEDDQQLFPPYQVAPVVRQEVLDANPDVRDILNSLAPLITDEVMQSLNYQVTGEAQEPDAVALQFLQESGLLEAAASEAE